jgi:hypothetical protein
MLFTSQAYLAALNALFAEYNLGYIELTAENPFASDLKAGVLSAFKAGDRSTVFDKESWIATFNHANRLVQLNFVAIAFNELGQRPMLAGEDWKPVRNPMVIKDIASKIDKASRYIFQRHGKTVVVHKSRLTITDWGIADLSGHAPLHPGEASSPNIQFIAGLPHPDFNKAEIIKRHGELLLMYYENVRTFKDVAVDGPALFTYPQAVVVVDEQREPLMIVRLEESTFGTSMLCSIDPTGKHFNHGPLSRTERNAFLEKAAEFVPSPSRPQ